jgi:hypothetical protein
MLLKMPLWPLVHAVGFQIKRYCKCCSNVFVATGSRRVLTTPPTPIQLDAKGHPNATKQPENNKLGKIQIYWVKDE